MTAPSNEQPLESDNLALERAERSTAARLPFPIPVGYAVPDMARAFQLEHRNRTQTVRVRRR